MSIDIDTYRGIAAEIWAIERQMTRGCFSHSCTIQRPTGQATNGPCECGPRRLARRLMEIADRLEKMNDKAG